MKAFLVNLTKRFGKKRTVFYSLGALIITQILFLIGNNSRPDFAKITSVMPDLHPEYSADQVKEILVQYSALKSALLTVYGLDMVLPFTVTLFILAILSILLKYLFSSYSFLSFFTLLFPLLNLLFDYLENIMVVIFSLFLPNNPPIPLLQFVTNVKIFFVISSYLAILTFTIWALYKKFVIQRT